MLLCNLLFKWKGHRDLYLTCTEHSGLSAIVVTKVTPEQWLQRSWTTRQFHWVKVSSWRRASCTYLFHKKSSLEITSSSTLIPHVGVCILCPDLLNTAYLFSPLQTKIVWSCLWHDTVSSSRLWMTHWVVSSSQIKQIVLTRMHDCRIKHLWEVGAINLNNFFWHSANKQMCAWYNA